MLESEPGREEGLFSSSPSRAYGTYLIENFIRELNQEVTVDKRIRERRYAQRRKKQIRKGLVVGMIGLGTLAFLGSMVWNTVRPTAGEEIAIMATLSSGTTVNFWTNRHTCS